MQKTKVVCIGEALIDRIRNKSNQEFTDFLGGAPANVACALRKLKIYSAFIGRLGRDEFGKEFISEFNKLDVDINFLQLDENRPTRIVKVSRDQSGDRYFSGFDSSSQTVFADETLNIKCQPIALNSGYIWPKSGPLKTKKNLTISILEPINPNLDPKEFLFLVQKRIYEELDNIN